MRHPLALAGAILASSALRSSAAVISVNFREDNGNPNQTIAPTTMAGGGAGVSVANWNNVVGGSGSASNLVDNNGNATTASIVWSSGGMWGDGTANTDADAGIGNAQLIRGYLDDNQGDPDPIVIRLADIPFATYDIVVYFSTDTGGDNYGTITATTADGVFPGSTSGTKELWGTNPNLDSTNSLRISGLSGDVTIDAPVRDGDIRHSVAGVQVIIPEPGAAALLALAGVGLALRRHRA